VRHTAVNPDNISLRAVMHNTDFWADLQRVILSKIYYTMT